VNNELVINYGMRRSSLISKLEHCLHNWGSIFGRAGNVFLDVKTMAIDHRWIIGRDYDCERVKPIAYKSAAIITLSLATATQLHLPLLYNELWIITNLPALIIKNVKLSL
jgi:hypothetical protein